MKFEFNWPSGFRGEDVWKCWRTDDGQLTTDDGRRSHWYTNSSPRSLRLRWANNSTVQSSPYYKHPILRYQHCTIFTILQASDPKISALYNLHQTTSILRHQHCSLFTILLASKVNSTVQSVLYYKHPKISALYNLHHTISILRYQHCTIFTILQAFKDIRTGNFSPYY